MNLPTQLFIDGGYRDSASDRRTTLINPASEEAFAEVAAAALFLASNEAGYVTGHTLHVNGGMAMI